MNLERLKQNIHLEKYTNKLPSATTTSTLRCCRNNSFTMINVVNGEVFCPYCGRDLKSELLLQEKKKESVREAFKNENMRLKGLFTEDLYSSFGIDKNNLEKSRRFEKIRQFVVEHFDLDSVPSVDLVSRMESVPSVDLVSRMESVPSVDLVNRIEEVIFFLKDLGVVL